MFFDWLTIYQDHDQLLPILGDRFSVDIDAVTGEQSQPRQPTIRHEGSFSTSLQIRVSGCRVTVSGNPSRFDRLDNLIGFTSLDDCIGVYNRVLLSLGLPPFTKCTRTFQRQGNDGERVGQCSDGAVITEIHITSNRAVGQGNTVDYIRALSTQRYRNSIPRLHTNGRTCDWLSQKGNAHLVYPSVYDKAHEMQLHHAQSVARRYGSDSAEFAQFQRVVNYCNTNGVVRFEQKLKSAFLRRHNLRFWGLFDEAAFRPIHDEFVQIDKRLEVTAMSYETIAQTLLRTGVCENTKAANCSAMYALAWMSGATFDFKKSAVKVHRARLRKIGIDIAGVCDITRHSPIRIKEAREIEVSDLPVPEWYELPSVPRLRLVA